MKDDNLWKRLIKTVTPLHNKGEEQNHDDLSYEELIRHDNQKAENKRALKLDKTNDDLKSNLNDGLDGDNQGDNRDNLVNNNDLLGNQTKRKYSEIYNFDKKYYENLRRNKIRPDATLDLHGYTFDKARDALLKFLYTAKRDNWKIVLVITGKGHKGKGVIKTSLPNWLNEGEFKKFVHSYHQAAQKDGGAGAFYIRIRK